MAIYINADWTGTESGTKAEPYSGLLSAYTADGFVFQPNETYLMKAGVTDNIGSSAFIIKRDNIWFDSYTDTEDKSYAGSTRPKLKSDANVLMFTLASVTEIATNITFKNLDIEGTLSSAGTGRGIYIKGLDLTNGTTVIGVLIENCLIHNHSQQNIRIYASDVTIRNCDIYDSDTDNIFVAGADDITIEYNRIWNSGLGGIQADGIQMIPITTYNGHNTLIRYNEITNISGIKQCIIAPCGVNSDNCIIENNTLVGDCAQAITLQGQNAVCRYNKITASGSSWKAILSITGGNGNKVYSNLIIDNTTSIIVDGWKSIIMVTTDNDEIYNNVIISSNSQEPLTGINFNTAGETGSFVRNNIIQGMYKAIGQVGGGNSESNNLFHNISGPFPTGSGFPTVDDWTNADAGAESTLVNNDPLFIDVANGNYNLQQSSPCVGVGYKYWGLAPRPESLSGEPCPDVKIDLGAYQSTWDANHPANL